MMELPDCDLVLRLMSEGAWCDCPIPWRPWWTETAYDGYVRTDAMSFTPRGNGYRGFRDNDGEKVPLWTEDYRSDSQWLAAFDAKYPIPRPPYCAGQVWLVRYDETWKSATIAYADGDGATGWYIRPTHMMSPLTLTRAERLDSTSNAFLIYDPLGPHPWAPASRETK